MPSVPPTFERSRLAAHALAEHVLCAVRYAAVGRIGLMPIDGGVAAQPFEGRVVGLSGLELVDRTGGEERRAAATTLRASGEFFGVAPGAPPLWAPVTAADLDAPLALDGAGVAVLADWFALVAAALTGIRPQAEQTIWPEHFDLAVTADGTTFGGSPGDAEHPEPYLYVLPPEGAAPDADRSFWNEPFGASFPFAGIHRTADAVSFFTAANERLAAAPSPEVDR